jgi:hypothetical protein
MKFDNDDLRSMLNVLDMCGELDDWKEEVDCPENIWITPPPFLMNK